jgi:glycerol uptake facilitator-like aquaporin
MMAGRRKLPAQECVGFIVAQLLGAFVGVALADVMFSLPVYEMSVINRNGSQILLSECVGTFGLIGIVWCCQNSPRLPAMIAVYVGAAFWFTPTGFVNPAVTIARAFTESPSGITLGDVPAFVGAEFVGAVMAVFLFPWLMGREKSAAN